MSNPKTNKAVPDYDTPCEVCGQTPTVRIVTTGNKEVAHTEMCGACAYGEADCIDPDNW